MADSNGVVDGPMDSDNLAEFLDISLRAPDTVSFEHEECQRVEYAMLIYRGFQPSEIRVMSDQQRCDVLSLVPVLEKRFGNGG